MKRKENRTNESFIKFKKKIILELLIKCVIIAISVGLISFSIPYIIIKVKNIEFNIIYLIIISLAIMLLLFGLLFMIFKPNNKKIAKRLDKELNLNEKVQTMVEFEKEEGFIVNLQRENTNNILSNTSLSKITMKFSAFIIILGIIALSLCITSFAIPDKKIEDDPITNTGKEPDDTIKEPEFTFTKIQSFVLQQLIEYVKASTIEEHLKTLYVEELTNLINTLESTNTESDMIVSVKAVITNLSRELDKTNLNNEINLVFKDVNHSVISALVTSINSFDSEKVYSAIDSLKITINGQADAINEIDRNLGQIINKSNLNKNDDLVKGIIDLNNDLLSIVDEIKGYQQINDDENVKKAIELIEETIDKHKDAIVNAVKQEQVNNDVTAYVISELIDLFDIEIEEEDVNIKLPDNSSSSSTDKIPPIDNNGGGYGTGEVIFGSDDSIYDPEKGKIIFGDVIAKYQADILSKKDEGLISEDLIDYFEYYYNLLFGILNEEE